MLCKKTKISLHALALFVLIAIDQISKFFAANMLENSAKKINIGFQIAHNYGVAFGIQIPAAISVASSVFVLVFGGFLYIQNQLWNSRCNNLFATFLLAGAIGNLIDRVRLGYVVDFIKIYSWPNFNFADVLIVFAVFGLAININFFYKKT